MRKIVFYIIVMLALVIYSEPVNSNPIFNDELEINQLPSEKSYPFSDNLQNKIELRTYDPNDYDSTLGGVPVDSPLILLSILIVIYSLFIFFRQETGEN